MNDHEKTKTELITELKLLRQQLANQKSIYTDSDGYLELDINQLTDLGETVNFAQGELLFSEGTFGSHVYVIKTGKVEIFKTTPSGKLCITIRTAGEIIGELSLLDQLPRTAGAMALNDCVCLRLNKQTFDYLLSQESGLVMALLKTVVIRWREIEAALAHNRHLLEDLSTQKQNEAQLLYQASILEQVSEAIIATDITFHIKSWNHAAERLYGYDFAEVVGKPMHEIAKTIFLNPIETIMAEFGEKGIWAGEIIQHNQAGQPIDILSSISLVRNAEGTHVGAVAVNRDISARKLLEKQIRHSREKYRLLFDNATMPISLIDITGKVLMLNNTAARLLNKDHPKKFIGKNIADLLPHDAERLIARHQEVIETDQTLVVEDYFDLPIGRRWYLSTIHPMKKETFSYDAVQIISNDITERKEIEKQLQDSHQILETRVAERTAELETANIELAKVNRFKNNFLTSMSHELRTPLSAILGVTDILEEQAFGPLNERQEEYIQMIQDSGRHLLELINDILDLAKIEANQLELIVGPAVLNDICQSSVQTVLPLAHKKQIIIEFVPTEEQEIIRVDQRRLKQILVNLLANAVKFTPQKGLVQLKVSTTFDMVDFIIEDTGIGIPDDSIPYLFKPFIQLDSTLARQYEGTGLGLALVDRLVGLHNGNVSVTSEMGQGSRFVVSLPR
ncbi:ATP-binding protein [Anaerolineales bacterium HSG6]|nr:ATP-binding protein [Anaerolineales bacterium HSG6]